MTGAVPVIVHVAVGVILDQTGKVLIARRPDDAHQGGLLEFPGGKCEPNETIERALDRELHEELGIRVIACHPLCKIQHDYGDKHVLLDVWVVDQFTGVPQGREGQPLQWLSVNALTPGDFPAANRSIITHLRLPKCIAITGTSDSDSDFLTRFDALLATGIARVHLRDKRLSVAQFSWRAQQCLIRCRTKGVALVISAHCLELLALEADGYHLGSVLAASLTQRPVPESILLGVSCHDAQQLQMAEDLGADYAFLSPVAATGSHPEAKPLGWQRFGALAARFNIPVVALGGMSSVDYAPAKQHGAAAIASISAFWPQKASYL